MCLITYLAGQLWPFCSIIAIVVIIYSRTCKYRNTHKNTAGKTYQAHNNAYSSLN